jgi:hypothetical protein
MICAPEGALPWKDMRSSGQVFENERGWRGMPGCWHAPQLFFFFYKNLFARSKYTHFSTGKYKNCSWPTNLPAEHSLCEEVTVLSRQGMEGTAVKKWHK